VREGEGRHKIKRISVDFSAVMDDSHLGTPKGYNQGWKNARKKHKKPQKSS